jgi:hypothetical protein
MVLSTVGAYMTGGASCWFPVNGQVRVAADGQVKVSIPR